MVSKQYEEKQIKNRWVHNRVKSLMVKIVGEHSRLSYLFSWFRLVSLTCHGEKSRKMVDSLKQTLSLFQMKGTPVLLILKRESDTRKRWTWLSTVWDSMQWFYSPVNKAFQLAWAKFSYSNRNSLNLCGITHVLLPHATYLTLVNRCCLFITVNQGLRVMEATSLLCLCFSNTAAARGIKL